MLINTISGKVMWSIISCLAHWHSNAMDKLSHQFFPQSLYSTNHLSCQYCSLVVRTGHWQWIKRGKSRPLKTNAAGGCLAYHTESKMKECVWQQVGIHAGCQELLLSTVRHNKLSWFGHVCRHDTLQKNHTAGNSGCVILVENCINRGWTTLRNGQASSRCHCCTSRLTEVDGQPSQWKHLSEHPNDAWASRE